MLASTLDSLPLTEDERYFQELEYWKQLQEFKTAAESNNPQLIGLQHLSGVLGDRAKFCEESLMVQTKEGELVPFIWNPAQVKLNNCIDALRKRHKPVRIIILKSRRAGFSTGVAGRFFSEIAFREGQGGLIVAHEYASVQDALYPMFQRFQEHYRPFKGLLRLSKIRSNTQSGLSWTNGSSIRIATAKNMEGARSFGYRYILFSEAAFYPDFKRLMTAALQTVPKDPMTMVIVESTPNGIGGHYYDLCMEAMDPQSTSEWTFLFFGWNEDPDCSLRLPMPPDEFQETLGKIPTYNVYPGEELELMRDYRLTLEQLYWRRWCITNNCQNSLDTFHAEYAINSQEAFVTSGSPALDLKSIARYRSHDGMRCSIRVEQVGVEQRILVGPDPSGDLIIYRKPYERGSFVAGIDTASGIDSNEGHGTPDRDFSVAQILDQDTGEQCAILRGRMYEYIFGQLCAWLGRWYNWAYLVPEVQSNTYGRATLDAILRENYPMDRIYHRRNPLDSASRPHLPRYDDLGFRTDTNTRPGLISALNTALMERAIELYDLTTITECQTFIKSKSGKPEAQAGCKDDCVLSLALAVVGLLNAPRIDPRQQEIEEQLEKAIVRQYSPRMRDRIIAGMPGAQPVAESPESWYARKTLLKDKGW